MAIKNHVDMDEIVWTCTDSPTTAVSVVAGHLVEEKKHLKCQDLSSFISSVQCLRLLKYMEIDNRHNVQVRLHCLSYL